MYKYLLIVSFTFLLLGFGFGQDTNVSNSGQLIKYEADDLTLARISEIYNEVDLLEILKDGLKLEFLNYMYSKSFVIVEGQTYTEEQRLKIDVSKHADLYQENTRLIILDDASQINIELKSRDEINLETEALRSALNPDRNFSRIAE